MYLNGIHHVTAVSGDIQGNLDFYTQVLGLRLVKRSVNQDDTGVYHLFYADKLGSPGTDMTFFDWPHLRPMQPGADTIAGTAFRVSSRAALDFWAARLAAAGVPVDPIATLDGRALLPFRDPEGQRLYLVDDRDAPFEGEIWSRPDIPDEQAVRGFYAVALTTYEDEPLLPILQQVLNFAAITETGWIDGQRTALLLKTTPEGGPGREVWIIKEHAPDRGHLGTGGVHHVAFRVADTAEQNAWLERISGAGLSISPQIDRFWFQSIYFRVSTGILFEIATDGPGFGVDESMDALGETLVLPPFLEPQRERIEANLRPLEIAQ